MPVKPMEPKKEPFLTKVQVITATICLCIVVFLFVSICSQFKEKHILLAGMTAANEQAKKYQSEVSNYIGNVRSYILSIDRNYMIDNNGNIPVLVSVTYTKDNKSKNIGSDLAFGFSINNHSISKMKNTEISINIINDIVFASNITEYDPSSDDIGSKTDSISTNFLEINDGITYTHTVRVKEYYGNDAGNTAIYHVTYHIEPKKHLSLSSTQRQSFPSAPSFLQKTKNNVISASFIETIKNDSAVDFGIGILFLLYIFALLKYRAYKSNIYKRAMEKYNNDLITYNLEKEAFLKRIDGKSIREVANVPKNVLFTKNDLPYTEDSDEKYGIFTLYYTPSGSCFHTDRDCPRARTVYTTNMISRPKDLKPCNKCAKGYTTNLPSWYFSYRDIKKKIEAYEITDYIP